MGSLPLTIKSGVFFQKIKKAKIKRLFQVKIYGTIPLYLHLASYYDDLAQVSINSILSDN